MNFATIALQIQQTLDPLLTRFIQPQGLIRIATRMPQKLNFLVVEKLLNSTFAEQINDGDFDFLENRQLQLEIIDASLFVGLSFHKNRLTCQHFHNHACTAEVTLSIDSLNAIHLIQQEIDPDTLFFQRKLRIQGDTELAHHMKNTIDTLNPEVIPRSIMTLLALPITHK